MVAIFSSLLYIRDLVFIRTYIKWIYIHNFKSIIHISTEQYLRSLSRLIISTAHKLRSAIQSFEEVHVSHVKRRVFGNPYLFIVENDPTAFFEDMRNIMAAMCRCTNVAHYPNELISCTEEEQDNIK